jgi:hypothetical protein
MKILLLGTPRSGSTSLVKFIDSHIKLSNYQMVIEPFNNSMYFKGDSNIETLLQYENILVKNLFLLGHEEYPTKSFNNIYEYLTWCYSYFDKIIILDRRDKLAQSESFVINEKMSREKGIGWHTPKIYDLTKIETSYIETMVNRYTESSKILYEISQNKGYPIFYYEDIFLEHDINVVKNMLEYLGIELILNNYNEFILSPYRRVRIEKSNKKLL